MAALMEGDRWPKPWLLLSTDNTSIYHMRGTLVGTKEVAELLGVTRQRVNRIVQTHQEFPSPVGILAGGRIWNRSDIVEWARRTGRSIPARQRRTNR